MKLEELKTKFKERHDGNLSRALWIAAVESDFEKIISVVEAAKAATTDVSEETGYAKYLALHKALEALGK